MNNKTIHALILSSVLLTGCHGGNNGVSEDVQVIKIEADKSGEVAKSLKIGYQQFELNDSSQIGTVGAIEEYGDRIFVSSGENNSLLVFSSAGKFVSTVGSRGEGPGEYIDVTMFSFDPTGNRIFIYDEQLGKLVCYDAETYAFKEEYSYPKLVSNCGIYDNGSMIWFNQSYEDEYSDKYFTVTDMRGTVENSFVDKTFKSGYSFSLEYPLYRMDGDIYGYIPFDMAVYRISSSGASPRFKIEVGDYKNPTTDYLEKISDGGQSSKLFNNLSNSGYISSYSIYETPSTLCVSFMVNKENHIGLYDMATSRSMLLTKQELADMLGVGEIEYMTAKRIGDSVLAVLNPGTLIELSKTGYEFNDSLKALIPTLTEEDNPIILKLSF